MKLFKRKDELDRLSDIVGEKKEKKEKGPAFASVDATLTKGKTGSKIARDLAQADLKLRVIEFIGIKIVAAFLGLGFGLYLGRADTRAQVAAGLVCAFIASFIPEIYIKFRAASRIKTFNAQLGDTITMMANSLRGGYSFLQTMDLVSKEAPEPTATEFKRVVQEVGLGRTTAEALANLLRRVPSDDLDLLITAVNIQHEVGGNLAQILDSIGHTIRERVRIKGEIKTLTAQGRLSGYVITGLPIAMGAYITLVNPEYMSPIFTFGFPPDAWCCLPVTSLAFIAIGYVIMMKIVDIEV
jgi:tight adherence protein B